MTHPPNTKSMMREREKKVVARYALFALSPTQIGREKEECARDETKNNAEEESRRPHKNEKRRNISRTSLASISISISMMMMMMMMRVSVYYY